MIDKYTILLKNEKKNLTELFLNFWSL